MIRSLENSNKKYLDLDLHMDNNGRPCAARISVTGWMNNTLQKFMQDGQAYMKSMSSKLHKLGRPGMQDAETSGPTEGRAPNRVDYRAKLEKQLQTWRENNQWVDPPPKIEVTVPKGTLCNLEATVQVGLPPDAVFDIVIDPENKRVFKNIKEVSYRKVLEDDGYRQLVEVEQAAIWRFLWWSGTIAIRVYVDQDRRNHMMTFRLAKEGFMKKFEGSWRLQPLFVDEEVCKPFKPSTLEEYESCSHEKGRVASLIRLQQLVQPALIPPPPISWYVRGITAKTTEMLVEDLQAEVKRIREGMVPLPLNQSEGKAIESLSAPTGSISLQQDVQTTGDDENPNSKWHQKKRRRGRR